MRGYIDVFYFIWGLNRLILTFILCDPRIHHLYYSRGRLLIVIASKLSYGKVMCSQVSVILLVCLDIQPIYLISIYYLPDLNTPLLLSIIFRMCCWIL